MASFRYFRKHQKTFLAVAAVLAIFLFVIGDAMFGYIGQAGGGPDPNKVAASWKGGKLTAAEIERLTQRRYFVSQFLQNLMMKGAQRVIEEGGNPLPPAVPNFIINEGTTANEVIVNVVSTRILADQGRKAGISIGDDVINHFLREVSFRRVTGAEIQELLQQMRGGNTRGLEEQLFSGLRELLLGHTYMTSYSSNIRNVLPEQRWDDWRRINEQISLEVATIPVSDFVKEVPDPSETELLAFYEEYKDDIGHQPQFVMGTELPSATPGFKQPRRVKVEYLLGDVATWSQKFEDSVTEEEIADYYERNKRTQFVKSGNMPEFDESLFDFNLSGETDDSEANAAEADDARTDDAATGGAETDNAESDSATDVGDSAAEETPADETASPPTSEPESASEPAAADDTDTTDEQTEQPEQPASEASSPADATESTDPPADATGPGDDETGFSARKPRFRLAAFQADGENEGTSETEAAAEANTASEESADAGNAPTAENAEDAVDGGAPAKVTTGEVDTADTVADDAPSTADSSASTDTTPPAGEGSADDPSDAASDEDVEYEPLDSVRDVIRLNLARDKAVVELKKTMDRIYGEMQSEFNPYGFSVVAARSEKKEIPAPPAALTNLRERAIENNLISEETVLLTQRQLADTAVGKATDVQTKTTPVWYAAFDDLELYEPMLAQDIDGNFYLVTKTEDVPEKIPAFEDIRAEVVRMWKEREAAKLALAKAEELAAEAEKAGETLATFFVGKPYEVLTTDMFSWLTFGTTPAEMQRGAKLGDAPPLEAVGPEFMAKAFDLEGDDVAAQLNYDHSKAYVFRLDRREATPEELRSLFLREANNWYGGQVMMLARLQNQQELVLQEILERVGFDNRQLEEFLQPTGEDN